MATAIAHWWNSPYKSVSLKRFQSKNMTSMSFHLRFYNDAAVLKTIVPGLFSPPIMKSPNSTFLKWAPQCTRENSVFPFSGYPACKGGLEGLCLTPETQPRCWTGAKWAESCAALPFSWTQSSAAICLSLSLFLLQLKISLGREEQTSQRRCTWYYSV